MHPENKAKWQIIFFLGLIFYSSLCQAENYYVSALTGSDSNVGLNETTPFLNIQTAANLTLPGDTVFIMEGTYSEAKIHYIIHNTVLYVSKSGSENKYITYINYPGHHPVISGSNCRWACVEIRANYIRFEGMELEGPNQDITYEEAMDMYEYYIENPENRDWNLLGTMNTGGITLGTDASSSPFHHIEVRNCIIHDFQGGGIGGSEFDYVLIENNKVYNNSWYGMYATSGISLLGSVDTDTITTEYKIIVRGNICFNNKTLIPWAGRGYLSDGNGIIIDSNKNLDNDNAGPYNGRTLVENNVSYNNGGSGIHAYNSNRVDIINNTAYNNGTVVAYAEIFGQNGNDIHVYNNIMYARKGGACNSNDDGTTYDYNIYYNGPVSLKGPNDLIADPKFVKLAKDETADLSLRNTSPAINSGAYENNKYSHSDISGIERPVGSFPDRGAYESPYLELAEVPEMIISYDSSVLRNGALLNVGDVYFSKPDTVDLLISNMGSADLLLTENPVVSVEGTGYKLIKDAPSIIKADSSCIIRISLNTIDEIEYIGLIRIVNNDEYENPYLINLTGKGKDPQKADQRITFNAFPLKYLHDAAFIPEAKSSSGLPLLYESSSPEVAEITDGKIYISGLGKTVITASQPGDSITHPAEDASQILSVIEYKELSSSNLLSNPDFDLNTTDWSLSYNNNGKAEALSVEKDGYSSNVASVSIISLGNSTSAYNVQYGANISVKKGKTYSILFKASAEAERQLSLVMFKNISPWSIMYTQDNIIVSSIPASYGPFYFNCTTTESLAFRFLLGISMNKVFIDDVEIREVLMPEINVKQGSNMLADGAAFDFGNVQLDSTKAFEFVIENVGGDTLELDGNPVVVLSGEGFYLDEDVPAEINPGTSASFRIGLTVSAEKKYSGSMRIYNNDSDESPYKIALSGNGYIEKTNQIITFPEIPEKIVGDEDFDPGAFSSADLPISYTSSQNMVATIVSNKIHIVGSGTTLITAFQEGDAYTYAAEEVSQLLTVIANDTLGIHTVNFANKTFCIYPNPVSDEINITYFPGSDARLQIHLFDIRGNIVLCKLHAVGGEVQQAIQLDVSDLIAGLYFLKFSDSLGHIRYHKMLISR